MNIPDDHPTFVLERITKRLSFIVEITNKLTKHFNAVGKEDNTRTFCLLMLDRLRFASEGVKALLPAYIENNSLEYSIGIIIRSAVLDYICVLHVLSLHTDADPNVDKKETYINVSNQCHAYLVYGIRRYLNDLKRVRQGVDKHNPETISNNYINLVNSNPHYFEPYAEDGTEPKLLKPITSVPNAADLFTILKNSNYLDKHGDVYIAYSHYSKYDHFGSMFYDLSRKSDNIKLKIMDLSTNSLATSLYFINLLLYGINAQDIFLKTTLEKTKQFIEETP